MCCAVGLLGPRNALNITYENEPCDRSAVIAIADTKKMASRRARQGDDNSTVKVSKFFRKISGM